MPVMSRASTSLELSEFFKDDDSDGHRLAEFLQKRRGGVQRQKFLFMNCEPLRLSLDVQLEKVSKKKKQNEKTKDGLHDPENRSGEIEQDKIGDDDSKNDAAVQDQKKSVREEMDGAAASESESLKHASSAGESKSRKSKSPVQGASAPIPRLSSVVRKSGGISPGDHLRRYSFNRRSKLSMRRRTLLQDFENTISDSGFVPKICSTPLSQTTAVKKDETVKESTVNVENAVPNAAPENENSLAHVTNCCGQAEKLLKFLESKDRELRSMVETIPGTSPNKIQCKEKENQLQNSPAQEQDTNSSPKRTYNIEKGILPGQVILTPEILEATPMIGTLTRQDGIQSAPNSISKQSNILSNRSQILTSMNLRNTRSNISECYGHERSINKSMTHNKSRCHSQTKSQQNKLVTDTFAVSRENDGTSHISKHSPRNDRGSLAMEMKTTESSSPNRSHITIRVESPRLAYSNRGCLSKNTTTNNTMLQESYRNVITTDGAACSPSPLEIPNTQNVNITIACAANEGDVVIPETQDVSTNIENCVKIQSTTDNVPVVVIPVNNTLRTENVSSNTTTVDHGNNSNRQIASRKVQEGVMEEFEADNLKLTDIMTDDEEPTVHSMSAISKENNSQAPLNLAARDSNSRVKRLRKRSMSRRRLQLDRSQVMSTETETEPVSEDIKHSIAARKRNMKKARIPLNKPPGPPLNGEQFAKELARMSNYEIVDLRKRNSMGQIFLISGRKSAWMKEQAVQKQIQLDDEIELELLRRNIETETTDSPLKAGTEDIADNEEIYLPAPDEFGDTASVPERDSSLINEKSCDRVSFRTKKHSQKRGRPRKNKVPEVLQRYLDIPKKIGSKKDRGLMNNSKRSLYTENPFGSPTENIANSSNENNNSTKSVKQSLPCVPSPPPSDPEYMPPLRVVSPPPPLAESLRESEAIVVNFPPPPSQFESDSGIDSNTAIAEINKSMRNHGAILPIEVNSEEDVFKKPLVPPPKIRGRRKKDPTASDTSTKKQRTAESQSEVIASSDNQSSSEDTTDASESSTLRRSKRGHVPLKNTTPLFQLLFQQVLNIHDKKRKAADKKKIRDISKNTLEDDSSVSRGLKAASSHKKKPRLVPVPEADDIITDVQHIEVQAIPSKTKSKTKSGKVKRKEKLQQNDDNLECSRIKMSEPPPLDHFNNVFDHLRNSNVETPTEKEVCLKQGFKEKKVKVRMARLKHFDVAKGDMEKQQVPETPSSSSKANYTQSTSPSVSSTAGTNQSNFELISWLKNITEPENVARNDEIFKEMRISSASNLCFTELQGVEYAFYDTEDKASLGYLRFKPRQIKPKKRARRYHLHFVTLVGNFRITANDKESRVGPGDMVAIEKSVYYDIENVTDDIGLLMVIKK